MEAVNAKQAETVYELVLAGSNVYLHGPGGGGKSYALRKVCKKLIDEVGSRVACTASTGCAATGYAEFDLTGCTIHSWAGMKLATEPAAEIARNVMYNPLASKRILETDILAIDEISMLSAEFMAKLDTVLKTVRKNEQPFGGMVVLAAGDFMQLSPFKGEHWVFEGPLWEEANFFKLVFDQPLRHAEDLRFHSILEEVRMGQISSENEKLLRTRLNAKLPEGGIQPTTLFPTREAAERENTQELAKLPGIAQAYMAEDIYVVKDKYIKPMPKNLKEAMDKTIANVVWLKVGAQVMLKKNLDIAGGLVNGTKGVVLTMRNDSVEILLASGAVRIIEKQKWTMGIKGDHEAKRTQIPLILAWGLTIHSSQGATLDVVRVDVGARTFAGGQAYVALSRVRTLDGLYLISFEKSAIRCDKDAKKYVLTIEAGVKSPYWEPPSKRLKHV
jgi:ATP-dependent DNA helicase PIF1